MLATALDGIPIYVEKNASAAAVAERVYGNGRGCSNLIYLNLASGVGAGIIIADQIFRGSSGYGGEVGHIPILSGDAPLCVCGRHGCFEALCGTGTVMKRIMELPDEVFRSIGIRAEELRIEDVIGSPIANHPEVQKILGHVGRMVGIGVATLINLFEPEAVILGGPLSKTGNSFINAVVDTVGQTILTDLAERVRIRESSMTTDPVSMGVYAMVIDQLFALGDWKRPKGLHKD
jgi:predicted NBD/HSP70 family sugar kinase